MSYRTSPCLKAIHSRSLLLQTDLARSVTGRIKTSHLWAIQNQPLTPCGTRDAFRPMVAPQEGDRGWQ